MLEGLWTVRFLRPSPEEVDLLSGIVVIETGRILGGDSGYVYIGTVGERDGQHWPVTVRLKKYDDRIEGYFNDSDEYELAGRMAVNEQVEQGLLLELGQAEQPEMLLSLEKVAELPN